MKTNKCLFYIFILKLDSSLSDAYKEKRGDAKQTSFSTNLPGKKIDPRY